MRRRLHLGLSLVLRGRNPSPITDSDQKQAREGREGKGRRDRKRVEETHRGRLVDGLERQSRRTPSSPEVRIALE